MRLLLVVPMLLLSLVATAGADDWMRYDNARYAYRIEVPPDFTWGREADNGDGRAFRSGATRLAVWGGEILADGFEAAARDAINLATGDGWKITYEAVTPGWVSFSGTREQRVLYQRMIPLCSGTYVAFRLEYTATELARLDPVVNHLVASLEGRC